MPKRFQLCLLIKRNTANFKSFKLYELHIMNKQHVSVKVNIILKTKIVHKKLFLILFMVSFLSGIVFTNVFGRAYILGVGLMGEYFLLNFQHTQINFSRLFIYVFKERIKLFLLIGILGITNIGIPVISLLFMWLGFSSGVLLSVAILKFGLKGILVCMGGIFPQFLIYIPVILFYSDKIIDKRFLDKKTLRKQNIIEYILFLVIGIIIISIGVILESYINPFILKSLINLIDLNG
ncbi:stage II sporulation protein M [Lachnotalea glycerini]|uniref:Stage II sporulation protein M n=1 Tax=Lachnotalea glycerini TaxID=1763509 RepID=A0A318EXL9_9FIRM|nr:stage II sporulation protein M [Lachnotalea glycerini]PXV95997.1 stage II sporulation protein M [Lachnotalea glycerini]